ncbi:DUF1622 domain-containing protein [Tautonia rosea]|uniref:DUF1622 domain-containing protein n=1 Tax=Tautonia rosea TaxID=2728037 RepID=UPI0014760BDE|nr:DUF1622 domain-containing protein [Tautonia rosea]
MTEMIQPVAKWCAAIVEMIGIVIITGIAIQVVLRGIFLVVKENSYERMMAEVRQHLGKGILLGLEFLIAADIIHTVAVDLTFESITVLAVVVLIRTFLSFTLEAELRGNWPWPQAGGTRKPVGPRSSDVVQDSSSLATTVRG